MSQINTISEFLLHAGTDFRVFDMARGIRPIDSQIFLEIETAQHPTPRPRQQHAWFGILFFNKQASSEHYIWFVKLPLDEQGLVIEAGRQQFLHIVVEALGTSLDNKKNPNNQLPDNPFTFIPGQQQLADFNSLCKTTLKLPLSKHLDEAIHYIQDPTRKDWRDVSLQGVADYCASLNDKGCKDLLIKQFKALAPQMQLTLGSSLENHSVASDLSQLFIKWYQQSPKNIQRLQTTLRALCQSEDEERILNFLQSLLQTNLGQDPSILMLIAARHWACLTNKNILSLYIENLAACEQDIFVGLYSDLVQIPDTRQTMLDVLRWPDKSTQLTKAIGHVFGQSSS